MTQQTPAQELIAKDLHGTEWHFKHIFRGQPKRHLLTTRWSAFVTCVKCTSEEFECNRTLSRDFRMQASHVCRMFEKQVIRFACWTLLLCNELFMSVYLTVCVVFRMSTAIAIEDVRNEVKILRALNGDSNLIQFHDAYEDHHNVYIVMEGGKYAEDDAKIVMIQILNVVFCHLQGVVHRDIKPENFLFTNKEEDSVLKAIDFGLSDFVKPDEKLNDIVGSTYHVAPELLHRVYNTEADVWSVGVIVYILLCGS